MIPHLESIKNIEKQFHTGEEPVMVLCSDLNPYICKYMRSSATSYKLTCEFIGSQYAKAWGLTTPDVAFVWIKDHHWNKLRVPHLLNVPSIGSKYMEGVIDISSSTYRELQTSADQLSDLLKIALFDIWISNEDRNINNANLMYQIDKDRIVAIDFGCIFNTATFDSPLSQLTLTDTILYSDLFKELSSGFKNSTISRIINNLKQYYTLALERSAKQNECILMQIPVEWSISDKIVKTKIEELFDNNWIKASWENFVENVEENIK